MTQTAEVTVKEGMAAIKVGLTKTAGSLVNMALKTTVETSNEYSYGGALGAPSQPRSDEASAHRAFKALICKRLHVRCGTFAHFPHRCSHTTPGFPPSTVHPSRNPTRLSRSPVGIADLASRTNALDAAVNAHERKPL